MLKKSMRKGLCNGEASTSTLDQRPSHRTLEEMILKLEMEEEKRKDSVVMCARDALNQYPRFSLDGKDAMYRSSFRDQPPRRSLCQTRLANSSTVAVGQPLCQTRPNNSTVTVGRSLCQTRPANSNSSKPTVVVWCKPGVVARLMGLDAMPMPMPPPPNRKRRPIPTTQHF